jgi:hypothetical protein
MLEFSLPPESLGFLEIRAAQPYLLVLRLLQPLLLSHFAEYLVQPQSLETPSQSGFWEGR